MEGEAPGQQSLRVPVKLSTTGGVSQEHSLRWGLGLQAMERYSKLIEFDCRKADCGLCIISVLEGAENLSPQSALEKDYLKAMRASPEERLACQCRILGPVHLSVQDEWI